MPAFRPIRTVKWMWAWDLMQRMTHSGHARLRLNNRAVCCTCSRPVLAPRAIRRSASKLVAIEAKRTCRERRESVDPAEIDPSLPSPPNFAMMHNAKFKPMVLVAKCRFPTLNHPDSQNSKCLWHDGVNRLLTRRNHHMFPWALATAWARAN